MADAGKIIALAKAAVGADVDELKSAIQQKPDVKDSTKTGVDLDVSDENGNVIVRFAGGHIKTKNFDSSNAGADMVKDSTKSGVDLDVSDPSGNVILRISDGHIQTKNFNSADYVGATILTVKSSGGDYTSIRAAVEAAASAGASEDNPFVIQIAPGNYDILSYFTSAEIAESGFYGLMLTNGITLEGMGTLREHTVLYAEMDTTTYDSTKRNDVSTINFRGNVGLKNLTVRAKNMRYAVHDDFSYSSDNPKIRRVENCNFYAEATTSWNIGNVSYGAGTDGNKVFLFDDCDFNDTILIHTDYGNKSNLVVMNHCKAFQFLCKDFDCTAMSRIYLYGCDFRWIRESKIGENWSSQHLVMHGDVKGAFVEGWEGMQYELGDSYRIQQSPVTTYPKAVTSATTGRYHIQTTADADEVTGIVYFYDSTNDYALVQFGGWICAELLGFESPAVGEYLVVGSGGALSLGNSSTNAIGRVVFANENGSHFIKLSI